MAELDPESWLQELDRPTEGFFRVFAARAGAVDGVRDLTREAVRALAPRVDWEGYLPHFPHGLLGLRAIFRLRPHLSEGAFLRALATQLYAFAHEARRPGPGGLQAVGKGSGNWTNLRTALHRRLPALAFGEMLGIEEPSTDDFLRLGDLVRPDMANVGHKPVVAHHLGELFEALERPRASGRRLLAITAWLAAAEPVDTFWRQRSAKRLGDVPDFQVPEAAPASAPEPHQEGLRELCDLGLVALLDRWTARLGAGAGSGDLLAMLVLAAAEKQLDARRDLEGKTSWNFVYLATHALHQTADPHAWSQAAALVNLFPTDEAEDRIQPNPSTATLLDAVLDVEPQEAMFLASKQFDEQGPEAVLAQLAEAATDNDPSFNHSHQTLAVAAGADLLPLLPAHAQRALLAALAKSLANSQGSADLGRLADRELRGFRP
jgi:hypothetical protein